MADKKQEETKVTIVPEEESLKTAKDPDELVHEKLIVPDSIAEHDPDEAVHIPQKIVPVQGQEIDVDDLLHRPDTQQPDR